MKEKRRLLGKTRSYQGTMGRLVACGRDFNVVRFLWECNSDNRMSQDMRRFSKVIKELEFLLLGGSFTWSGGLNNESLTRLDQFLVSKT